MKIELTDKFYFPETERSYTPEGYLIVPATISRPGIQVYKAIELVPSADKLPGHLRPNDIVSVYRPPEEVFNVDSINSFKNIAVTNNHPPEFLNSKNHKLYSVGTVLSDVLADDKHVQGTIKVTDYETINEINEGKVDVSAGYHSNVVFEEGVTPEGENYQAVQRDIIGNHVAVVMRGRAGSEVKLADGLDDPAKQTELRKAEGNVIHHGTEASETREENSAKKSGGDDEELGADGVIGASSMNPFGDVQEGSGEGASTEEVTVKTMDEVTQELKDAYDKIDELTKSNTELSSKVVDQDMLDQLVLDRMDLIDTCKGISPDWDFKGKSNQDIKKEVLRSKLLGVNLEDKSQEYIDAAFDVLKLNVKEAKENKVEDSDGVVKTDDPKSEPKVIETTKNVHEGENPNDSDAEPEKDAEEEPDSKANVTDSVSMLDSAFELEIKNNAFGKTLSAYEEHCRKSRDAWKKTK